MTENSVAVPVTLYGAWGCVPSTISCVEAEMVATSFDAMHW